MTDAGDRRARRAWIRDHHPDRGGDPAAFAEGLARFGRSGSSHRPGRGPADRPTVRRTRPWRKALRRLVKALRRKASRRRHRSRRVI